MRTLLMLLIAFSLANASCRNTADSGAPSPPASPLVEGTVYYFRGGGTVEMLLPAGFRLSDFHWIVENPDSLLPIYLYGAVDSSYIDSRVRAFGTYGKASLYGSPSTDVFYFINVRVDSLQKFGTSTNGKILNGPTLHHNRRNVTDL